MSWTKILQRQFYSVLSSRWLLALLTFSILAIILSAIQFGEVLLEWSVEQYEAQFSLYRDNIAGKSFEKRFVPDLPVDIVYTWVNGSDPILLRDLELLKSKEEQSSRNSSHGNVTCPFMNCVSCDAVIMDGRGNENMTSDDITRDIPLLYGTNEITRLNSTTDDLVYYIKLPHQELVEQLLFSSHGNKFKRAFVTTDRTLFGVHKLPDVAIVMNASNRTHLPGVTQLVHKGNMSLVYYQPGILDQVMNGSELWTPPSHAIVFQAYLLWQPFRLPGVANSNSSNNNKSEEKKRDDLSVNRFYDNEELRYSLRSVDMFAPWIRRIYLVTNGQIPSWLQVDHPRLTIVTHEEIFTNHSHLPTFSSPAIETHLHRIPGLSRHFIYLNDDVMFGDHVTPEDFVTGSRGYKVYMAWSVPYCAEGCPPNWINDKYCDRACNNSMCDFDGEDCKNRTSTGSSWHTSQPYRGVGGAPQCSPGCIPSWLGDRYCDHVCRVAECGFDTADCGTEDYANLYGVMLSHDQHYIIPTGVRAAYFNLSNLFYNHTLSTAEMTQNGVVVSAIVSQKFMVLTVVFHNKLNRTTIAMTITGTNSAGNKTLVRFNITMDTSIDPAQNGTTPPYSFPQFNTTSPEFIDKVAMTIQSSDHSINYWVTERTATGTFEPHPLLANISTNITGLPNNITEALSQLEKEYTIGDLTHQGLLRRQHILLAPFINESHENHVIGRRLLSLDDQQLADWVADSKRKQLSLDGDMKRAIWQWEWQHGPWHGSYRRQQHMGKLPWEKDMPLQPQNDYTLPRRQGRHLLDTFADSLRYVNKLYNKVYGYVSRKVPAHMPHMINKDIIQQLQDTFPEEFEQTSSHKLRTIYDMQFSFAYFYYVISSKEQVSIAEVFKEMDVDLTGILSTRELRTLMTRLYELPIYLETIEKFENMLKNCSQNYTGEIPVIPNEDYQYLYDPNLPLVTLEFLQHCTPLVKKMNDTMATRQRYKTEELGEDDISFKMINENATLVLEQLDWVRKHKRKFICINDNINHNIEGAEMARMVLRDFFESLFPNPSQFELPRQYRNRFLYMSELKEWQQEQDTRQFYFRAAMVMMMSLTTCLFFHGKLVQLRRKITYWLFPRRRRDHTEC
ncbi:N-acetylglucosamine-1-phosphotransferase subunits alpha/beta-like [Dysidea avara]|uniref:N-acetylglucosamine-1-phosphotransferase subunits alpha/beta-like n=1 Tax=Dysidea avara TaxID=196820 RepID=UPI0033173BD4